MINRSRLRRLIVISLVSYTVVLSLTVSLHGYLVNEYIEELIWESMLESEMAYIKRKIAQDPEYDWSGLDRFHWYDEHRDSSIPPQFQALPAGMHDEVRIDGSEFAILIEDGPEGAKYWHLISPILRTGNS